MAQETSTQDYIKAQQARIANDAVLNKTAKVTVKVYTNTLTASGYVFKNGKRAQFVPNGDGLNCYTTDIPSEQAEFAEDIELRHPNIAEYTGQRAPLIEPMEVLRKRHFAEFEAQQARALSKTNDAGTTSLVKLNTVNSHTVAEGAAGSGV